MAERKFELVISCTKCLGPGFGEKEVECVPFSASEKESMEDVARRTYHALPAEKKHRNCGGRSVVEIYVFARELVV